MGNVIVKLFAAVLDDRLTCWVTANERLSAAQKSLLAKSNGFHARCMAVVQCALIVFIFGCRKVMVLQ